MPLTIVERKATLAVFIGGGAVGHVKAVRWSAGFNQPYPEAHVVFTQFPAGFSDTGSPNIRDQTLQLNAGNGTNNAVRFLGLTRDPEYNLDGTITLRCVGQLWRAYTYENGESPTFQGGLYLADLLGSDSGTDADVVKAVLTKASVVYTAANIGGTGVIWGSQSTKVGLKDAYLWHSGDAANFLRSEQQAGESALEYIHRWDQVSAIHPGPFATAGSTSGNSPGPITAPVGFYRTFETLGGVVYRKLIGGRPRGTPDAIFTEGTDIRLGQIGRRYPTANRFIAIGFDSGKGGPERFVMQSSNPFMPAGLKFTAPPISSPMIEKSAENDAGNGMSCERITYALDPELNRIIVAGRVTTGRDDAIGPGVTLLIQAAGGAPGRLGTGEKVWVQAVSGKVDESGFEQEFEILGGGFPDGDNFLPAVPQ